MFSKVFIVGLALLLGSSCASNKPVDTVAPNNSALDVASIGQGYYRGMIPCASCEGIQTTIIIEELGSYDIINDYLKGQGGFRSRDQGKINLEPEPSVISLINKKEIQYFAVHPNHLELLDQEKKKVEGELASYYRLQKLLAFTDGHDILLVSPQSIRKDEFNHMHFQGIWTYSKPREQGQRSFEAWFDLDCSRQNYQLKNLRYFQKSYAGGRLLTAIKPPVRATSFKKQVIMRQIARLECED